MKFASLALLLLAAVSSSAQQQHQLRGETAESNSCGTHKSESDCKATSSCVWCKCAAVPSACYSEEDAKSLPPGVFDCEFPKLLHTSTSDSHVVTTDENKEESSFEYGLTHTIADGQVAGDLCDSSSPKSYSGYMNVKGSKYDKNGEDKNLFFWMFEKRSPKAVVDTTDPKDVPFIVWLTGGPGCSSTLALLTENGPCSVNKDGTGTVPNPYSWTEAAHVLWLDQPAGVGFSYGKETDVNEEMVSEDAYYFLQSFYKEHPEYKANPLFVVGESYGGHYAPAIGNKIHQKNKKLGEGTGDMVKINLKGVAVGNGLTMPEEQYKWYAEMGYNNSHNIKVFNEATYNQMKGMVSKCTALIRQCNKGTTMIDTFACQTAFTVCNMAETSPYQMTGKNPYDIRKKCDKPPLCYDFSNVDKFLNLQSTRTALHVSPDASKKWNACNMMINMKFHTDWMKDMSGHIKDMLNDDLSVLIYAGDVDFICNYLGNRAWTLGLDWKHKDEFTKADDHEWNEKKGLARSVNGFTYLQVYDAGHMVPSDQPKVALDMIRQFTSGEAF